MALAASTSRPLAPLIYPLLLRPRINNTINWLPLCNFNLLKKPPFSPTHSCYEKTRNLINWLSLCNINFKKNLHFHNIPGLTPCAAARKTSCQASPCVQGAILAGLGGCGGDRDGGLADGRQGTGYYLGLIIAPEAYLRGAFKWVRGIVICTRGSGPYS